MSDIERDWEAERTELLQSLKESLSFFSNAEKLNREKWVVRSLLKALSVCFREEELTAAAEPVDVAFRDMGFQVKEIFDEGRKRTDEFKRKIELAHSAQEYSELLEHYDPASISFSDVAQRCFNYADQLISGSKYGPHERQNLDLVCYFNWLNHTIVCPIEVLSKKIGFRSLSVVSNRYCAVLYADQTAPDVLKSNVGKVVEHIEA